MFLLLGVAVFGAASYELYILKPQFSSADAIDAGLLAVSIPGRVSCRVRVLDSCRAALGGLPKYLRLQFRVQRIPMAGDDIAVFDLPTAWRPCIRFVGTPAEACTVLEANACTVPAVCAANATPQVEANTCACRAAAGTCTVAGQPAKFGVTLAPGTFTGAGCVSKFCGPLMFGDPDWPAGCPE